MGSTFICCRRRMRSRCRSASNLDGSPEFPGVGVNGGSYKGLQFITSNTARRRTSIALQPALILYADDGGVTIDASHRSVAADGQRADVAGRCDHGLCVDVPDERGRPARGAVHHLEARRHEHREIPHRDGLAGADRRRGRGGRRRAGRKKGNARGAACVDPRQSADRVRPGRRRARGGGRLVADRPRAVYRRLAAERRAPARRRRSRTRSSFAASR